MSVANSKKSTTLQHTSFEWAGAVARIRRNGGTARSGRRSALLSMLTASYTNTSRSRGRSTEGRTGTTSDHS